MQEVAQFALGALGLIYTEQGEYDRAKDCYERSMNLARQFHFTERLGYLYLNLGVMYYQMQDYDAAHDCFIQGGDIAEQIGSVELRIQFLWNRGALASIRFAHKEAFLLLRSAFIEAQDNDLKWMKPRILIALGKAHLRSELPDAARRDFIEAWSLPALSVKHAAQCLYGLSLSIMLKEFTVGNNDVETSLELAQPLLDALSSLSIPLSEVIAQLDFAHETFQHDLDHFPHLERFRINDMLQIWASNRQASKKGADSSAVRPKTCLDHRISSWCNCNSRDRPRRACGSGAGRATHCRRAQPRKRAQLPMRAGKDRRPNRRQNA